MDRHRSPNPQFLSLLLFFLLGSPVAFPSSLQGQDTRNIQGVVRDALNGEAIVHATVLVVETGQQVNTNTDGFFTVVGAPGETFSLRVVQIGYTPNEMTVDAGFGGRLEIEVAPLPVELEGVEFVADEYRLVKATDGVSRIAASPAEMAVLPSIGEVDVFRSLQLLPGISGTRESSSGLYVRGGTPDQNLVLLDGITVYHVDHFFGFFSAFNADAIKDIQVFKGAFPAQYGGRVSSVVDMTGKTGDPDQMHYGAGLNLLSASGTFQTPIGTRANLIVTGRRSYTDLIQTGLYNSIFDVFNISTGPQAPAGGGPGGGRGFGGPGGLFGSANQDTATPDFYFYDFNAKLTYLPGDRDVVAFSLYGGRDYLDRSQERSLSFAGRGGTGEQDFNSVTADLTDWGNQWPVGPLGPSVGKRAHQQFSGRLLRVHVGLRTKHLGHDRGPGNVPSRPKAEPAFDRGQLSQRLDHPRRQRLAPVGRAQAGLRGMADLDRRRIPLREERQPHDPGPDPVVHASGGVRAGHVGRHGPLFADGGRPGVP